jgi:hypothetical protein
MTIISRDDSAFYPSRVERWLAWVSLVVFTGMSAILILARIFNVQLFGA